MAVSRLFLAGLLAFALSVVSFPLSGSANASDHVEHHAPPSISDVVDPGEVDPGDTAHVVLHCGAFSCTSSYVAGVQTAYVRRAIPLVVRMTAGDGPQLRSLYLDCDPPVPRRGFSEA